jgi:hypothetical protein
LQRVPCAASTSWASQPPPRRFSSGLEYSDAIPATSTDTSEASECRIPPLTRIDQPGRQHLTQRSLRRRADHPNWERTTSISDDASISTVFLMIIRT